MADNASSVLYVLGTKHIAPAEISLPDETMRFYRNGELLSQGRGADVMGDPAVCVAWLANKLATYGVSLKKGEVILSGALQAAAPARRGDCFEAVYAHLGTVTAKFE